MVIIVCEFILRKMAISRGFRLTFSILLLLLSTIDVIFTIFFRKHELRENYIVGISTFTV